MVSTVVLLAAAAAAAATSAFVAPGPVLPLRRAAAASPRRATVAGVDADAVTAAVNAALSDDVAALATELTELGTEIRRANGRTSGTASMLSAEVSGITAKGLALRCVVRKRAWASWGNKDRAEYDEDRTTLVPWPADHPAGDDGRELTLALMSLFRQAGRPLATAVLLSLPELGGDEDSGLGAAGLLPTNMWLNNVPHLSHVRTHFEDAVVRAVDESLTDPRVPPEARARQRVSLTFPELVSLRRGGVVGVAGGGSGSDPPAPFPFSPFTPPPRTARWTRSASRPCSSSCGSSPPTSPSSASCA